LVALLERDGLSPQMRFGVNTSDETFSAHAWVEVNGLPIAEDSDVADRFSVFEGEVTSRLINAMD
jgi:hypothetical protein